jgi:hypothetical protein
MHTEQAFTETLLSVHCTSLNCDSICLSCLQKYAVILAQQLGLKGPKYAKKLGENLDENKLDQMREDQLMQLYELFLAAKENNTESKEDNRTP